MSDQQDAHYRSARRSTEISRQHEKRSRCTYVVTRGSMLTEQEQREEYETRGESSEHGR
jgi:hypothetical protein